jgi:hypothetical protein
MKVQQSTAAVAAEYGRKTRLKPSTGVRRCKTAAVDMLDLVLLSKAGMSCVTDTAVGWAHVSARGHCVCGPAAAAVEAVLSETPSGTRLRDPSRHDTTLQA